MTPNPAVCNIHRQSYQSYQLKHLFWFHKEWSCSFSPAVVISYIIKIRNTPPPLKPNRPRFYYRSCPSILSIPRGTFTYEKHYLGRKLIQLLFQILTGTTLFCVFKMLCPHSHIKVLLSFNSLQYYPFSHMRNI